MSRPERRTVVEWHNAENVHRFTVQAGPYSKVRGKINLDIAMEDGRDDITTICMDVYPQKVVQIVQGLCEALEDAGVVGDMLPEIVKETLEI